MSNARHRSPPRKTLLTLVAGLVVLFGLFRLSHRASPDSRSAAQPVATDRAALSEHAEPATNPNDNPAAIDPVASDNVAQLAGKLSDRLQHPGVRAHEAVLLFKDAAGYNRFLAHAGAAGVIVVGKIEVLHAVRVRVRAYDRFAADLVARAGDFGGVSANPFVDMPPPPASSERDNGRLVAVGNNLLATLGVPANTDTSNWGRGVTIAILDGGAAPDPAFGPRLRYLDIGLGYAGTGTAGQHGTAVASLAAGAAAGAPGVAPAATLLSIRVIDTDDHGDVFTVCHGLIAAVDARAQIINLSLGGRITSEVLNRAIAYATARGVVLVAAAGNEGVDRLSWPAADTRVISVGATDANGRQAGFSNSGPQLRLSAPGVGLVTAGMNPTRILFSGTSASAPVVAGAIAVILSQSPGLTGAQAAEILQTHATDGGAVGDDPNYGHGTLDLGWALARDDLSRTDTAITSHTYNPETNAIEVGVQNRSASPSAAHVLTVNLNGRVSTQSIAPIGPGRSTAVVIPLDTATAAGLIELRTQLESFAAGIDAVPANNTRASLFDLRR
jgi:hypothetical protein